MKFDTLTAAGYAADKLALLLERAERDTTEILQTNDIPKAVAHYAALKNTVEDLAQRVSAIQKLADSLSYESLPTMMGNQDVKTITVDGVGRVSVNVRFTASMLNKERAMEWLRTSGNEGLIIETVPWQTLSSFAKTEMLAGKPLPDHLFKVGTAQHLSITPV